MENEKFITVLTVTFPHEVAVIRGRLEAEGITCFVKDEMTVQVNPFYSNAIGGVKLQVLESDLNQAVEILKETGYIKEKKLQNFDEPSQINEHSNNQHRTEKGVAIICPICGSEEVVKTKKTGWLFLLTSLLFMCPTPFLQRKYYCFNCKQEFKLKRQ
jgi:Zn finger protein HypA/HybF involved in hydrogenase expression